MPVVTATPRGQGDGQVLREFVDSVGTASVTYSYPNTQESLIVRNTGQQPITVTVGGTSQIIQPGQRWEKNADFTSFSIVSTNGVQSFEAVADEKGSSFSSAEGRFFGNVFKSNVGSQPGAVLMSKLALGIENVVVVIAGDSTSASGTIPWPKQVAKWIADQFPAYTVNYRAWNDTGQVYDALGSGNSYIVQTGTGSFVLDIYNGSVSGSSYNYPMTTTTRWSAMWPVTPTLIFINYGHNTNGSTQFYRYYHYSLSRSFQESFQEAGIIQVAQNPRAAGDPEKNNDLFRARVVMSLAATEGYGLVNVTQTFLSDPNYATNLLTGDGLHPNDAGYSLWADEVKAHLAASIKTTPRHQVNRQTRLWIPASLFTLYSGTPSLALTNNEAPMWSMANAADSSVMAQIELPSHWQTYDSYIFWTTAAGSGFTGTNNTCRWRTLTQAQGLGATTVQLSGSVAAPGTWQNQQGANPTSGTAINLSAYATFATQMLIDGTPPAGRPFGYRVSRFGTDVADNIATPVFMMGVLFVRAR